MGTVGWGDVKKEKGSPKNFTKGGGSDLFVKLPEGKHTIRLVGKPHEIHIAWIKNQETGRNEKFLVPQKGGYAQRLKNLNIEVRQYFAVNCFVKEDEKVRIRILEKGPSIFNSFGTWYENFTYPEGHKRAGENIDPGGVDGPNFLVVAETPNGKNANQRTTYNVIALQQTPFNKAQLELLNRSNDPEKYKDLPLGERGLVKLKEFYDEEKAAERLDKKLRDLAGIDVDDDAEDAPIGSNDSDDDSDDEGSPSSDIGDILGGDDSDEDDSDDSTDNDEDDSDSDLVKQAEEVLGDLF